MDTNGYYACSRCYERIDDVLGPHTCPDRREGSGGTVILSDDYRDEYRDLTLDPIMLDMAEGLGGVPFSQIMHDGGTPTFDFMLASRDEYHARGGTRNRSMGGVATVLIALLITLREAAARQRREA